MMGTLAMMASSTASGLPSPSFCLPLPLCQGPLRSADQFQVLLPLAIFFISFLKDLGSLISNPSEAAVMELH